MNCHQREQAHHGASDSHVHGSAPDTAGQSVVDPVCGMKVDPARAKYHAEHAGRTFYFCCAGCWSKFTADPDRYVRGQAVPGGTQP
jgi:Cu+-exporting ATPase